MWLNRKIGLIETMTINNKIIKTVTQKMMDRIKITRNKTTENIMKVRIKIEIKTNSLKIKDKTNRKIKNKIKQNKTWNSLYGET